MTARLFLTIVTLLFFGMLLANPGHTEENLQQLVARADAASMEDRPALYIEIAERQLKLTGDFYRRGQISEAREAVSDVVTYAQKAHDASAQTGKRLKSTEIAIRKMAARLRDIKTTLNFEDQASVQAASDRLEDMRTDLMSRMWNGKRK